MILFPSGRNANVVVVVVVMISTQESSLC